MKPITVNYQKVFPLAPYVNERIGVDIQLDDGDSPLEALAKAKEMVEQFHQEAKKGLVLEMVTSEIPINQPLPIIETQKQSKEDMLSSAIAGIYASRDIEELKSFRAYYEKYPEAQAAYDEMKNKLQ